MASAISKDLGTLLATFLYNIQTLPVLGYLDSEPTLHALIVYGA